MIVRLKVLNKENQELEIKGFQFYDSPIKRVIEEKTIPSVSTVSIL